MNRFHQTFAHRHVVLPVIHVASLDQAQRSTQIARDARADGVFLINHGMADAALLAIHDAVADVHADWWIGVNCLGWLPEQVFAAVSAKVGGVWVDNAGIEEGQDEQPYAERVANIRQERAPKCLYFGGVAFKYQRHVDDLEAACRLAARYMDVATTSGPGTGKAAAVEKIRRMKQALGDTPQYVQGDNWLGVALSALMRIPAEQVVALGRQAYRRLTESPLTEQQKFLLTDCVEAYLPLTDQQRAEFQKLLVSEEATRVQAMNKTTYDRGMEKGMEQGRLEGMHSVLLRQGVRKFGEPSSDTQFRIRSIHDLPLLEELVDRMLEVRSWDELLQTAGIR